jgi:DNA polymerase-3 subunit alpha
VPALEDDRTETGAMEKETLGLFLSSHPLKEVRAALRARVECTLAELEDKKDGDWVTVGGMISESKKIRTRNGDPMMFATLDDLEGSVELLALGNAYEPVADAVEHDRVLVIRGRVDHKDRGETKLVAQDVEAFEPSQEEIDRARVAAEHPPEIVPIVLAVDPGVPASFIEDLKDVVSSFPGDRELCLRVGERRLVLGEAFRVSGSHSCLSDLASLGAATSLR